MIREEVQASVSSLTPPPPVSKKPRIQLESDSDEQGDNTYYLDGELEEEELICPSGSSEGQKKYLFSLEDLDLLLSVVRETMEMEEVQQPRTTQDDMFGGLRAKKRKLFLVNSNLREMILEEWEDAEKKLFIPQEFRSCLLFNLEDTKLWQEVPKIDVQVAKIAKTMTILFKDSSRLKDPMDRKSDGLLKRVWECSVATINTNIAATSVARAMGLWLNQLENHLKLKTPREVILDYLPLLKMATAFMGDASAESIRFASRSGTLSNTARRALWLKTWTASKKKLCEIPFSSSYVFGPVLDTILERVADKKKGFPEEKPKKSQPFPRTNTVPVLLK